MSLACAYPQTCDPQHKDSFHFPQTSYCLVVVFPCRFRAPSSGVSYNLASEDFDGQISSLHQSAPP